MQLFSKKDETHTNGYTLGDEIREIKPCSEERGKRYIKYLKSLLTRTLKPVTAEMETAMAVLESARAPR